MDYRRICDCRLDPQLVSTQLDEQMTQMKEEAKTAQSQGNGTEHLHVQ